MKKYLWVLAYILLLAFCILSRCTVRPDATPASTPGTEPTIHPPVITETPEWANDIRPTIIDPTPNPWPTDEPEVTEDPLANLEEVPEEYRMLMEALKSIRDSLPTNAELNSWYGVIETNEILSWYDYTTGISTLIIDPASSSYRVLYRSGGFNVTGYCGCEICCGSYGIDRPKDEYGNDIVYGSLSIPLTGNQSCAVDPTIIPYRSHVYLGGRDLRALDKGPDGLHIDVYHTTHVEAWNEPCANITHSAIVYWSDKDTLFADYAIQEIESRLQNGDFFDLNSINKDASFFLQLIDPEKYVYPYIGVD